MKLKVCGMKYGDNIKEVAKLKPDLMGFVFYTRSKRYVGEHFDLKYLVGLPKNIDTVGVFVNSTRSYILHKVMRYQLDIVQLHGDESPEFCRDLRGSVRVMKAFGLHDDFDMITLDRYKPFCDYFLFDTKTKHYGGSGKKFNWEILKKYDGALPFFLSGGISPENYKEIKKIKWLKPEGIDVNSRFELRPGLKDVNELKKLRHGLYGK